ncbi:MAG TPA: ABC transporter substrate-binding protein, partial [Acidimicrobiales bacterium]
PTPDRTATALGDDAITIGAFDFAESQLLGELYGQALESRGFAVQRAFGIGPREIVAPALARGLLELVPEYAGTALTFFSLGATAPSADVATTHSALQEAVEPRHLTALDAAPAQNANDFVVTSQTAQRAGVHSLTDVARVASQLTFGGPPECPERPLCLAGLKDRYGVQFDTVLTLDAGGPVTRQALKQGVVDVALLFSTDPAIADDGLVELTDDQHLQPAENVTPLLRTEVVERWGQPVVEAINAVSARLTTEGLRDLNARLSTQDPAAVAAAWLQEQGLQ